MEFETINMLYNGNNWENIAEVWEHNGNTLRVVKNDETFMISAEESYDHELLHRYKPHYEKLVTVNIGGANSNVWCPIAIESEYRNTVEECLEYAINHLNSNDIE